MIRRATLSVAIGLACVVASPASAQTAPPAAAMRQLQTPDRSGTANLTNAVEAPLHDLNIMREGIPPILTAAVADAYARPASLSCDVLIRDIQDLDFALGADFNEPNTPQSPSLTRNNGHIALALVQSGARLLLPYSGLVSTVTGARRHDQQIIEAITAGSVRRGYLKGSRRGAPLPATGRADRTAYGPAIGLSANYSPADRSYPIH